MTTLTPADVLRAAVEKIDKTGWWPGSRRDPQGMVSGGRHCMATAISVVTLARGLSITAHRGAMGALGRSLRARHGLDVKIIRFNDAAPDWETCRKEMLLAADAWERGELT